MEGGNILYTSSYIHYITVVPIKKINPMVHLCRRRVKDGNKVSKITMQKEEPSFLLIVIPCIVRLSNSVYV